MRLRSKPPVITDMWQPNSYTKGLFEAVGRDKNQAHSKGECEAVLRDYIGTQLGPPSQLGAPGAPAVGGLAGGDGAAAVEGEEAGEEAARRGAILALSGCMCRG